MRDQLEDNLLLKEIKALEWEGDELMKKGETVDAQLKYLIAF